MRTLTLPSFAELTSPIDLNYQKLNSFEGRGLVRLGSPELNAVHGIVIYYQKPDRLRLELKGMLGLKLSTLIVKDGRYYLETFTSPGIISGAMEEPLADKSLQLNLTGKQLLELLIPLFELPVNAVDAEISKDFGVETFKISQNNTNGLYRIWLDYFDPIVVKELRSDSDGDTVQFRQFSDYRPEADIYFPKSWSVQFGSGETTILVEVDLSQVDVNQTLSPLLFNLNQ